MNDTMCGTAMCGRDSTTWETEKSIATLVEVLQQQVGLDRVVNSPEVPPEISLRVLRERYAEEGRQLLPRYPLAMVEKALATIYHRLEAEVFGEAPPPRPRDVTLPVTAYC
ncbi:MAG: hypothetical protein HY422_01290 [Candidatus Komeilibacteria bacterium]|nr:hypothetical protein [Candidatus Komeilibacteria bacterium]